MVLVYIEFSSIKPCLKYIIIVPLFLFELSAEPKMGPSGKIPSR